MNISQIKIINALWLTTKIFLFCVVFNVNANTGVTESEKNWNFTVYLDGDEIGSHSFLLVEKNTGKNIYTKASFDVKFLFFNAYSYRHENTEEWRNNCLLNINAVTDDNGDDYQVLGSVDNNKFILNVTVNDEEKQSSYQPCLKTFAYWDSEFLQEKKLLNSQTGELVDVVSEFIKMDKVIYQGGEIPAKHYRLSGKDLQIDLWYSEDNHWLALESLTEGGRVVRYAIP